MLTVLNIAYPLAPVRPNTAGGAEQVVAMLDRALTQAKHHSVVVACQGSQIEGTLIATELPNGNLTEATIRKVHATYREVTVQAIERHRPNVIHLHGIDFLHFLPPPRTPAVATLHLPPSWYPPEVFFLTRPDTHLHCVSNSQRRDCPASPNLLPTIENGVPIHFRNIRKKRYAVILGRICPEKGTDTAIRAARAANSPLLIAGEVFPYEAHLRYFEEQVKPLIDGSTVRFLGPVGPRAKQRLLSAATCVLIPSNVAETSSLVAMESAMAGTPVIAFRMGALTEIVEHEKTGYLVRTEAEMSEAIARCSVIDPDYCRALAHERFSEERSQADYLSMYSQIAR